MSSATKSAQPSCGARILAVDDDPGLLALLDMRLTANGYRVTCAESGAAALRHFMSERPQAVISDLRMDGMDGHALFARLHEAAPTVPVIMLTAHGTIPDAVSATQRGIFAFLTKPFEPGDLLDTVARAVALSPSIDPARDAGVTWRAGIVSVSPVMDELLRQARRAADSTLPILINGPRGAGKSLLAQALHRAGSDSSRPIITLHCSALSDRAGVTTPFDKALSAARGGTLVLEDVDEAGPAGQLRLLALVGGTGPFGIRSQALARSKPVDVRIMASTAQPLENFVRDGRFRADLYYSLRRMQLSVPALSERREDIAPLVAHFTAKSGVSGRHFSPEAQKVLCETAWPGHVRQLQNVVELALKRAVAPQVSAVQVRTLIGDDHARGTVALDHARHTFEHDYLIQLLESTRGGITHAARIAGRNRTEFYKLLARHQIDPSDYR